MKYILLIIALICIWGGSQGVYTSINNSSPTVYDVNSFVNGIIPKEEWLQLENCNINLMESIYFESAFGNGLAEELFIPLNTQNDSITVFISEKSQNVLDVFNLINTQTDPEKAQNYFEKYEHLIFKDSITYSGIVKYGIDLDNKQWRQLSSTSPKIISKFLILDNNTTPDSIFSYFILGLGVLLLLLSIKSFLKKETE
ncbi:hypothetical protein LY01_02597 [Nonlabens xylanidelens]|uniref:Uncharacterized protein n=1 Tax=Nonlabens xylanidelens TaxID=191564 RepID=A0A2S6IGH3_9FLAO|nr:hypothetical protein [Nonlabens xylanidelens]PPK93312.1 hypothetical protein LY01_02597 [Nonlabens xylanidelens]PQJ20869.1 hypothetical protein BST94_05095 [Nonlabens xylanidelens]